MRRKITKSALARGVADGSERPGGTQPGRDGLIERNVQRRPVRADPGPHVRARTAVRRRVDVHAADDSVPIIENRVRKTHASFEVVRVALQVPQVLGE